MFSHARVIVICVSSDLKRIFRAVSIRVIKVSKGAKIDQESIQSSTTPDPGYQWESDKLTVRHHKREPRCQPFPSR